MSRSGLGMLEIQGAPSARAAPLRAEQERIEHLVLGRARPPARSAGRGRAKRKVRVVLSTGVEEAVQLRERWSHKQGTPETLEHASRRQQGAMARLYQSGAIDAEQLGAAAEIAAIAERIGADVAVSTASLEARVDVTRMGNGAFFEALGRVRREIAYTRWRAALPRPAPVLDMIARDESMTIVATRYRMHNRRARKLLLDALDAWPRCYAEACKEVDAAALAAAQAGIF